MREPLPDHHHYSDEQQLAAAVRSLKSQIAAAPQYSHAAAQAQRMLDILERPACRLTTVEKLGAVRATLHNFKAARLVDPVLFHPGDRRR